MVVHQQLQDPAAGLRQVQNTKIHRYRKIKQVQVPGQPGVRAVAEAILRPAQQELNRAVRPQQRPQERRDRPQFCLDQKPFESVTVPLCSREREKETKDSSKNIRKSRSPYDNVKPKINNRSLTLGKPQKESIYFLEKLSKIKDILKNGKKEDDKLDRIQQIM